MKVLLAMSLFLGTGLASAQTTSVVETFRQGVSANLYGWSFGTAYTLEDTGGNLGGFHRTTNILAEYPTFTPDLTGFATGDYRAQRIVSLTIDIKIPYSQGAGSRPLFLALIHDNGTADPSDDTMALMAGPEIAESSNEWSHVRFDIPAQQDELPEGWQLIRPYGLGQPLHTWADVIQDVAEIQYIYGDPTGVAIEVTRDIFVDNVGQVAGDLNTAGDFDRSGLVDVLDFVWLVELQRDECQPFVNRGDLDGSGGVNLGDIHWGAPSWTHSN